MITSLLMGIFAVAASIVAVAIYFLPSYLAFQRSHEYRWVILVINLVFGASIVGWVISLVWALSGPNRAAGALGA